jgi:hypothetical protein
MGWKRRGEKKIKIKTHLEVFGIDFRHQIPIFIQAE